MGLRQELVADAEAAARRAAELIAEAGAEGINLQFCSLVVNYDLPWNPQRIEQRIGRCHRYGQRHDVVVVNFLNRKNEADLRVYQLLNEKFQLFDGVFGASDEVLGALESGVDFEKRIGDIYQRCRQPEEIKAAFDALQLELSLEISEAMSNTRRKLLENFDDEVRDRLRTTHQTAQENLGRLERMLLDLTRHELAGQAQFTGDGAFRLTANPFAETMLPISLTGSSQTMPMPSGSTGRPQDGRIGRSRPAAAATGRRTSNACASRTTRARNATASTTLPTSRIVRIG